MKKNGILAISLVAVFAVSNAYADIASTTYVQKAASVSDGNGIISTISVAEDGTPTVTRRQLANTDIADRGIDAGKIATTKAGTEYTSMGEEAKETAIPTVTLVENIADTAAGGAVNSAIANYAKKSELETEVTARTNADNALGDRIDAEATARQTADNNITAKFGDLGNKTVEQAIADAKTSATYDDTALKGRVSANETAISNIQSSAAMTSGVTKAIVDSVTNATTGLAATRTLAQQGVDDAAAAQEAADDAAAAAATADGKAVAAQNTANTNKNDIAAIKTEQATQNTDIANLKTGKQNTLVTDGANANLKGSNGVTVNKAADGVITITGTVYDDSDLDSRVSANETAINDIKDSAVMKSGVTAATVTQVNANKTDIATIKTEQGTQNTNITNLQTGKQDKLVAGSITSTGTGNVISSIAAADGKITVTKTSVATSADITGEIQKLDGDVTGTGVVKTLSQTDGKVTATLGQVTATEIATDAVETGKIKNGAVTNEKITSVASSKVTGLTELATLAMPAACATNECALVYDKTTKAPKWEVVR